MEIKKSYRFGRYIEPNPIEEHFSLESPIKIKFVNVNKSEEGDTRQIFTTQNTIITITYSFLKGTFVEIKGEPNNVEESHGLWEKMLGAKLEKITNG